MQCEPYVKLFSSLLDSTIWQEDKETRLVWITMLAMKNRDGFVAASVPGLAKRAGVELVECERALGKLLSADPYSRTKEHDGRRVQASEGGWMVLNHQLYRDRMGADELRAYKAAKQKEYRARKRKVDHSGACAGAQQAIVEGLSELNRAAVDGAIRAIKGEEGV